MKDKSQTYQRIFMVSIVKLTLNHKMTPRIVRVKH